jgi:hypothetical protein
MKTPQIREILDSRDFIYRLEEELMQYRKELVEHVRDAIWKVCWMLPVLVAWGLIRVPHEEKAEFFLGGLVGAFFVSGLELFWHWLELKRETRRRLRQIARHPRTAAARLRSWR